MRLTALVVKELKQLRRDVRTLSLVIGMPIVVMVLFGWGYGGGLGHIPVAVANLDRGGALGWRLMEVVERSRMLQVEAYVDTLEAARRLVEEGRVFGAIVVPEGFTEGYVNGGACIVLITDESAPRVAKTLKDYVVSLASLADRELSESLGLQGPRLEVVPLTVHGPELKTIDAFMPVVLGMILLLLPATLISVAIAREREKGTFEALIMSPLRGWEIIAGKLLAYGAVTFMDLLLTLAIAVYAFDVLMRCSILDVIAVSALFMVGSLGLGLAASVVSRSQLQAYQISNFIFIPALLFCGAFVPIEVLTPSSRLIAYINPLYYFVEALRDLMVRGKPLTLMGPRLAPLAAYALATLASSIALFKARVE